MNKWITTKDIHVNGVGPRDVVQNLRPLGFSWISSRAYEKKLPIFNLKYGRRPAEEVISELGEEVVPHFSAIH